MIAKDVVGAGEDDDTSAVEDLQRLGFGAEHNPSHEYWRMSGEHTECGHIGGLLRARRATPRPPNFAKVMLHRKMRRPPVLVGDKVSCRCVTVRASQWTPCASVT